MTEHDATQAYLRGEAFDPVQFVTDLVGENPERAISWMAEDISWWLPGDEDFGGGKTIRVTPVRYLVHKGFP